MKRTGFIHDKKFLLHTPPVGHPERPERLESVISQLQQTEMWNTLTHIHPTPATAEDILAVHTSAMLKFVRQAAENGGGMVDEGDTHVVRESFNVAMLAAGAVINAIDEVLNGNLQNAFCAVRPPGHHAERDKPMGFCLFNNVAVGARYAQRIHGVKNVAILDWDVHHGNGTQHIFEDDPTVFYISLHQYPFYPGTGSRDENGTGDGKGFILNIPLPAGSGEKRYLAAFRDEIIPTLEKYKPELLLISAGFDAHANDPLGGMKLTEESFGVMTRLVKHVAPIVSVLEGGYDLDGLARSVHSHIAELQN